MRMSWPGLPARVVDLVIAVGVAVALLVAGLTADRSATDLDVLGLALLIIGGLSLAVRRRAPVAVLVITGVCAVGHQAVGFDVAAIAFLVAVYSAMRAGRRLATAVAALLLLGTLPLAVLVSAPGIPVGEAMVQARGVLELAWLIAAAAAGEALRQAERRADEAERTREETARRRADEERLHIARELHDTLTHQISVITVQSGAAVHLAQQRGEQVPAALLTIQGASREASRELRATLEALRNDSRTHSHGLDQLPALLERARTTGLDATLSVEGDRQSTASR